MNMQELISQIAADQKISKAKTRRVLGSLINQINNSLATGSSFRVPGLGVFKTVHRKERVCRNPQNGETINVPAKTAPKITFSKNVKVMLQENPLNVDN